MYVLVVKIVMFIFVLLFGSAVCYMVHYCMSSRPWDVCPLVHGMYVLLSMGFMSSRPWDVYPFVHGMYVLSSMGCTYVLSSMGCISSCPWDVCPLVHGMNISISGSMGCTYVCAYVRISHLRS